MKIKMRQAKLVEIIRKKEKASVEMLADCLQASRETIRRDLAQLARTGKIQKVHGGATMPHIMGEGQFQHRLSKNVDAKMKIAKLAATAIKPGETLFIDTGSTTLLFAEELARIGGVTVVTNSTEIARTIVKEGRRNRAFLLGGEFGVDNSQTVGTIATAQIRTFRAHHAVLTVGALDLRSGAMDYNIEEAQIARAMIEQSENLTVLADHSKFDTVASFEVCPLARIDRLICDSPPPDSVATALSRSGGELVCPVNPMETG